jgi:hypothetical protein
MHSIRQLCKYLLRLARRKLFTAEGIAALKAD